MKLSNKELRYIREALYWLAKDATFAASAARQSPYAADRRRAARADKQAREIRVLLRRIVRRVK